MKTTEDIKALLAKPAQIVAITTRGGEVFRQSTDRNEIVLLQNRNALVVELNSLGDATGYTVISSDNISSIVMEVRSAASKVE